MHELQFLARPAKNSRVRMGQGQHSKGRKSPTQPVFWCKKLKSIEIENRHDDVTELGDALSIISEGMDPAQWQRVKKSTAIVWSTGEIPHHTRKI